MSDDTTRYEGEDDTSAADDAEAAEAMAAAEESFEEEVEVYEEDAMAAEAEAALAEARSTALRARASWSLVHKEMLLMLLANCFFLAGVLAVWARAVPGETFDPSQAITGLDTIRGGIIFALAIYGFWTFALNVWFRQLVVWPYLVNALLALWVGIPGFTHNIGSDRWDAANAYLAKHAHSMLDNALTPLSVIPPGFWLLTIGGALVLIVLLKGIIGGASRSRAAAAEAGAGRRRRR
jgi:hypothetical protein